MTFIPVVCNMNVSYIQGLKGFIGEKGDEGDRGPLVSSLIQSSEYLYGTA